MGLLERNKLTISEIKRIEALRESLRGMGDDQLTWTLKTLLAIPTPRSGRELPVFIRLSIGLVEGELSRRGLTLEEVL